MIITLEAHELLIKIAARLFHTQSLESTKSSSDNIFPADRFPALINSNAHLPKKKQLPPKLEESSLAETTVKIISLERELLLFCYCATASLSCALPRKNNNNDNRCITCSVSTGSIDVDKHPHCARSQLLSKQPGISMYKFFTSCPTDLRITTGCRRRVLIVFSNH